MSPKEEIDRLRILLKRTVILSIVLAFSCIVLTLGVTIRHYESRLKSKDLELKQEWIKFAEANAHSVYFEYSLKVMKRQATERGYGVTDPETKEFRWKRWCED